MRSFLTEHYTSPFPGAMKSPLTTKMDFMVPSNAPVLPTYHVLDTRGSFKDPNRAPPDVSNEQILTWYKNMLTG